MKTAVLETGQAQRTRCIEVVKNIDSPESSNKINCLLGSAVGGARRSGYAHPSFIKR